MVPSRACRGTRRTKDDPLRPLFLADVGGGARPEPTVNMTLRHGVRASLEYSKSRNLKHRRGASVSRAFDRAEQNHQAKNANQQARRKICVHRQASRDSASGRGEPPAARSHRRRTRFALRRIAGHP